MIIKPSVNVVYKKTFLTGNLSGLTVGVKVPWSSLQCAEHFAEAIAEWTPTSPGIDAGTLARFFVTDINIEARIQNV